MPTSITVPIAQRTKSIKFGAAYSPSQTFNPDKKLLAGCSGVLSGMGLTIDTGPDPDQVTVAPGAFIKNGIIVEITSSQMVEVPDPISYPIFLVAENANEEHTSNVQLLFTTTPAADSAIIAQWASAPITAPNIPISLSLCSLREAFDTVASMSIQRERIVASLSQTTFNLPGPKAYELGTNRLSVYRNGKKLDVTIDYTETSPTQVDMIVPSTAGDVYEFIVFQGNTPISSIALADLTDVTNDLSNAIKDVGVLRAALATAANPLASMADITAAVAALLAGIAFTKVASFSKADGSFNLAPTGAGSFVDFPGLNSLAFTVTEPGSDALAIVVGQAALATSNPGSLSVNINLDGSDDVAGSEGDTLGAGTTIQGLGGFLLDDGGANVAGGSIIGIAHLTGLTAALHTIKLRACNAGGGSSRFFASPSSPFRIFVLYK